MRESPFKNKAASQSEPGSFFQKEGSKSFFGSDETFFTKSVEPQHSNIAVQKKCAACGEEDKVQKKEGLSVQAKAGDGDAAPPPPPVADAAKGAVPSAVPAVHFIAEDNEMPGPGQMPKAAFMERLKSEICETVNSALAGTPFSSDNCPYIRASFAKHEHSSAAQIEALIIRYCPAVASARSAEDVISQMKMQVHAAALQWLRNNGGVAGGAAQMVGSIAGGIGNAVSSAASGIGNAVGGIASGISSLFFKENAGGAASSQSPQAVMQSLGKGSSMDSSTKSRMEGAFDTNFSNVEIHTDSNAAKLSENMNARAFAVGNHIAFAGGEYRPGTLMGDALMAHELAHTVQQSEGRAGGAQMKGSGYSALEEDADNVAVNVMTKLAGRTDKDFKGKVGKGLKTGLTISRCSGKAAPVDKVQFQDMTQEQRQAFSKQFISSHFPAKEQKQAKIILDDMMQSNELSFRDEESLRIEIFKRMETVKFMEETQIPYGRAFQYPNTEKAKKCLPDNKDGKKTNPRVNKAAEKYWGPVQYDDGGYYFDLSVAGKNDAYKALTTLFVPQDSVCDKTLIHCDYLASVVHFRAFAESITIEEFNKRVKNGDINMRLKWNGFSELEDIGKRSPNSISLREVRPASENDLVIGDHVIFWNHRAYDLINENIGNAWRLENALLTKIEKGNDKFLGHGSGEHTNESMRTKLASEYNIVVKKAKKIIEKTKSKDKKDALKASADMQSKFPRIKEEGGAWKIQGEKHGKVFNDDLKEIKGTDPELIGLKNPANPDEMNCVKRPAESPGEAC